MRSKRVGNGLLGGRARCESRMLVPLLGLILNEREKEEGISGGFRETTNNWIEKRTMYEPIDVQDIRLDF